MDTVPELAGEFCPPRGYHANPQAAMEEHIVVRIDLDTAGGAVEARVTADFELP
ncbi:MAG TPA: hypothetical protein VF212_13825 [Longimicrobiales bacterium]